MEVYHAGMTVDQRDLFQSHLEQVYGPYQKRMEETVKNQKKVLERFESSALEYRRLKDGQTGLQIRERVITGLEEAYATYEEIVTHVEDGKKVSYWLYT